MPNNLTRSQKDPGSSRRVAFGQVFCSCRPAVGQSLSSIMVKRRGMASELSLRGRVDRFGIPSRTNRPTPVRAPSINYLAQVLSAFKAVSADAFVE